jgi:crotonobetainyl-CoA:carnitine CoA-transferase CaiB-like acyl-CoA transferase
MGTHMTGLPLDGVRVIDCANGLAGSIAALMLAEAGADVIKVEPPAGDPKRGTAAFSVWNRSKRSVALDIAGTNRAAFDRLLADTDVLVHDDATPDLDLAAHRHLISCQVRGLPPGLTEGSLPADDILVLAAMGILSEQPPVGRDGPPFIRFPLGSWCAAWLATIGITARIVAVKRGGTAGPVDTSLLQGALVPLMMLWRDASTPTPTFQGRIDKAVLPSLFECGDGVWLHLMKNIDDTPLMKRLLDEMGPEQVSAANAEWPAHFRYNNWGANVRAFKSRPSAEWLADLWAADAPVQPALPMGGLYADAQALANDYVVEVDDLTLGPVRQPGHPVTMAPPARVKAPAPALNADREAIFAEPARPRRTVGIRTGRPLLDGVRVVDFGNYLAGPLSTMMLADLGAEVIKVEPLTGDPLRANESAFLGCQRGKRSLALDLRHPQAGAVIERLVAGADIVHHNLRLPAARRFGLGYDRLKAIKPDLVYGHVSAYGPKGERRDWPGYDQLFQACSGWELANAGQGNRPTWLRYGMMDHLCAMSLAYGMLLALLRRDATGEGSEVAASLLGTSILTMSEQVMRPDGSLTEAAPVLDRQQMGVSPGRRLAQCTDGWIALVGPDAAAPATAELETLDSASAIARLRARGFAAVAVREEAGRAFLFDPDKVAHGLVARYPHPVYGELRHPGAFWTMPDAPLRLDRAPPTLGQHGADILGELGFTTAEVEQLVQQGVVALPGGQT